jgi:hypothetical protein
MGEKRLLDKKARKALAKFAGTETVDQQRAIALLAVDEGKSQSAAAAESGLSIGQVKYIRSKYLKVGLSALDTFGSAQVTGNDEVETAVSPDAQRLDELVSELDELVSELNSTVPEEGTSPYSPLHLITTIRDNLGKLAPDVQLGILESFEGMTIDDLKDIDTWKGLAYMMSYSARFQAGQLKDKMNAQLPNPLKPDTVIDFMKQNIDRFTPEIAKDIFNNLQGSSKEDWLDPDTWKGMWYMVNYSIQFQAEQLKQRLSGESVDEEL